MTYMTAGEADEYFGMRRVPDITFTTHDKYYLAAMRHNWRTDVSLPEGVFHGYVTHVAVRNELEMERVVINENGTHTHYPPRYVTTYTVTIRPTGAPKTIAVPSTYLSDPLAFIKAFYGPIMPWQERMIRAVDLNKKLMRYPVVGVDWAKVGKHDDRVHAQFVEYGSTIKVKTPMRYLDIIAKEGLDLLTRRLKTASFFPEPPAHPNCRSIVAPVITKEKHMKVRNRFYVASPGVTTAREQGAINPAGVHPKPRETHAPWTKRTLPDAIAHAEFLLEQSPDLEHVAITQIVRVVRRKKAPLVVEVVR